MSPQPIDGEAWHIRLQCAQWLLRDMSSTHRLPFCTAVLPTLARHGRAHVGNSRIENHSVGGECQLNARETLQNPTALVGSRVTRQPDVSPMSSPGAPTPAAVPAFGPTLNV
jgi:hypothetical protein